MATLAFIELIWERKVYRNFGKVVISFEINLSGLQLQHQNKYKTSSQEILPFRRLLKRHLCRITFLLKPPGSQHLFVQSQQWNNKAMCKICSKLTIKIPERSQ